MAGQAPHEAEKQTSFCQDIILQPLLQSASGSIRAMPVTLKEITNALAGVGAPVGLPVDQWIASDSATAHHQSLDPDSGLIENLYRQLSLLLSELWITVFQKHLHGAARGIMKDVVAKLCLWKENFLPGKLDVILQYSNYLRESVLDTLCNIGEMFIQSKTHCFLAHL